MAICGVLLLSWGVILIIQTFYRVRRFIAASQWPSVPGRVLSAYIVRQVGDGEPEIRLQYEYEVAGARYDSDNIAPGGDSLYTWIHPSVKLVQALKRGDAVAVRYDPAQPRHACLRPDSVGALPVFATVGLLSLAIGLLLVVWAR